MYQLKVCNDCTIPSIHNMISVSFFFKGLISPNRLHRDINQVTDINEMLRVLSILL
jgi:hypothetical protein